MPALRSSVRMGGRSCLSRQVRVVSVTIIVTLYLCLIIFDRRLLPFGLAKEPLTALLMLLRARISRGSIMPRRFSLRISALIFPFSPYGRSIVIDPSSSICELFVYEFRSRYIYSACSSQCVSMSKYPSSIVSYLQRQGHRSMRTD